MTRLRGRRLPLTVLIAAAVLLIASVAWASTTGWGPGGAPRSGPAP